MYIIYTYMEDSFTARESQKYKEIRRHACSNTQRGQKQAHYTDAVTHTVTNTKAHGHIIDKTRIRRETIPDAATETSRDEL